MENEEMQNQESVNESVVQAANNEEAAVTGETQETQREFERKPRPQVEVTDEMVEKSSKALTTMLDFLGLDGIVKAEKRPSKINLIVASCDAGRIIGRKGQSLESLQLLLNRMMQNSSEDFPKVYIDIDGYSSGKSGPDGKPARRPERHGKGGPRRDDDRDDGKEEVLRQQASDAAKEVRRWGESVTLPEMNSHDRRIIHITLENEADIQTESLGEGSMKSVVVSLKK